MTFLVITYQIIPLFRYLQQSSIEPSRDKSYTLTDITQAIEKATNTKVEPHCLHINEVSQLKYFSFLWHLTLLKLFQNGQHTYYLVDVRICLDKSLQPIDCNDISQLTRFVDLHAKPNGADKSPHGDPIPTPETCPSDKPIYYFISSWLTGMVLFLWIKLIFWFQIDVLFM